MNLSSYYIHCENTRKEITWYDHFTEFKRIHLIAITKQVPSFYLNHKNKKQTNKQTKPEVCDLKRQRWTHKESPQNYKIENVACSV